MSNLGTVDGNWTGIWNVAKISDSFNEKGQPLIFKIAAMSGKFPKPEDFGVVRLMAVDYVNRYYQKYFA